MKQITTSMPWGRFSEQPVQYNQGYYVPQPSSSVFQHNVSYDRQKYVPVNFRSRRSNTRLHELVLGGLHEPILSLPRLSWTLWRQGPHQLYIQIQPRSLAAPERTLCALRGR